MALIAAYNTYRYNGTEYQDSTAVHSFIVMAAFSFALFAIDCFDIFSAIILPRGVIIFKLILKLGLYGVTGFMYIYMIFFADNTFDNYSWVPI